MTDKTEIRRRITVRRETREETLQEVLMMLEDMEQESVQAKKEAWEMVQEWNSTRPEFRSSGHDCETRKKKALEESTAYYTIRRVIEEVKQLF